MLLQIDESVTHAEFQARVNAALNNLHIQQNVVTSVVLHPETESGCTSSALIVCNNAVAAEELRRYMHGHVSRGLFLKAYLVARPSSQ